MKTVVIRNGKRVEYCALPGKLQATLETACYQLDLPEDLWVYVNYDEKITDRYGYYQDKDPIIENRRIVGTRRLVVVYARRRAEDEVCFTLAHELGHAEHYNIGQAQGLSNLAHEVYADMAAEQVGRVVGFTVPSRRAWVIEDMVARTM